jgi:hypothetical protein
MREIFFIIQTNAVGIDYFKQDWKGVGYTLWSTLKFQRYSSRHIAGGDISRLFLFPLLQQWKQKSLLEHTVTQQWKQASLGTFLQQLEPRSLLGHTGTTVTSDHISVTMALGTIVASIIPFE